MPFRGWLSNKNKSFNSSLFMAVGSSDPILITYRTYNNNGYDETKKKKKEGHSWFWWIFTIENPDVQGS